MIIWSIAKTTVGDAMRKKVLQIFLVVAIGLIIISLSFSQTLDFSSKEGSSDLLLIKSFGLGLMTIAGWLISIVMGVSLIPQEIERRTIYTILSKPVKRYEFIIGKFLGAIMTLGICIGLMGVVYIIVIMAKAAGAEAPTISPTASAAGGLKGAGAVHLQIFDINTLWSIILIYFQFVVFSSVVMLLSVFLTPTVNFFMGLGVYVVGVMSAMIDSLARSEKMPLVLKWFYLIVYNGLPNFDRFNKANALLHPESYIDSMAVFTGWATLYAIFYTLIMMTIAVLVFEKKEV